MPMPLVFTLTAVFATVALLSGALASLVLARNVPERKRLRNLTAPRTSSAYIENLQIADAPSPTLKRFSNVLPASSIDRSRLHRRLAAAGYHEYAAAVWYSAARLTLPVVLGLLAI